MANRAIQQEWEKILAAADHKFTRHSPEPVVTMIADCDPVKQGIRPAYRTYLEARKDLGEALRERKRLDQEASREAERRYQLCEETIERAIERREKAELDALDAYRQTIDKASQVYKDTMKEARIECKQRVMDAWRDSTDTSAQIAGVFRQDKKMERPEDEGLQFRDWILHPEKCFQTIIQRTGLGRPTYEKS